jgi:hypothetical protein
MYKIIKMNFGIVATTLALLVPLISLASESYRAFDASEYGRGDFSVSKAEFRNGDAIVRIIEAKRTSNPTGLPYLCRAWLEVTRASQTTFQRYFDDIGAVGYSYGLFVPKVQPPGLFFAVVKNGDYDGRLFMVRGDGKVFDLIGGSYFISQNKRFLFSHYDSDTSGLAVFDLQEGRVVFSSEELPEYQHQWYNRNGTYFFTASEWRDNSGLPTEKKDVAYIYDYESHKIVEKRITSADLARSKPVRWDFDPRQYGDCKVIHNDRVHPIAEKASSG